MGHVLGLISSISLVLLFGLLQGQAGVILKLPDQKAQGFLVSIALKRLFPEYAHKLFGEMTVGI
jgi:hypothetical protein